MLDVWVVGPFASIIDSPNGLDLLGNASVYAPESCAELYQRLENHLGDALAPAMNGKTRLASRDLAHILTLATKGLKTSSTTVAELRRLIDGLISMAVATAGAPKKR